MVATRASTSGPRSVPLEVLLDPGSLHIIAPVADIPLAPSTEAAQFVWTAVHRNMDDRQAVVRVSGLQRSAERASVGSAGNRKDAGD